VLIVAPRHRALDQKPLNSPFLNKGGFAEKPWRTSCFFAGSASGGAANLPLSDVGSSYFAIISAAPTCGRISNWLSGRTLAFLVVSVTEMT